MTDAVNYRICTLNDGKLAIGQALTQKKKLKPYSFIIGDAYNFTPSENGNAVSGNKVFEGGQSLISGTILAKDTFKFTITLPETAGGFSIGNIILNLQTDDGVILPFLWFVSNVPYPKEVLSSTGSYLIISFVTKIINASDVLSMTITPPVYFSLAGYSTEADLPAPSSALFQQFVIQDPTYSPVPVIASRRTLDNKYWGTPLYSRIDEPFFGVLDGGRAGESRKKPYQGRYFWAGKLSMKDEEIPFSYGGAKLTDDPIIYNVGGEPLPDNPGYTGFYEFLNGEFIWGGRLNFPSSYYLSNFGGLTLTDSPETTFGGIKLPTL